MPSRYTAGLFRPALAIPPFFWTGRSWRPDSTSGPKFVNFQKVGTHPDELVHRERKERACGRGLKL
jgi:hypothetical protein